jgi:hypothetical protein
MNDVGYFEAIYANISDSLKFVRKDVGISAQLASDMRENAVANPFPYIESFSVARID